MQGAEPRSDGSVAGLLRRGHEALQTSRISLSIIRYVFAWYSTRTPAPIPTLLLPCCMTRALRLHCVQHSVSRAHVTPDVRCVTPQSEPYAAMAETWRISVRAPGCCATRLALHRTAGLMLTRLSRSWSFCCIFRWLSTPASLLCFHLAAYTTLMSFTWPTSRHNSTSTSMSTTVHPHMRCTSGCTTYLVVAVQGCSSRRTTDAHRCLTPSGRNVQGLHSVSTTRRSRTCSRDKACYAGTVRSRAVLPHVLIQPCTLACSLAVPHSVCMCASDAQYSCT